MTYDGHRSALGAGIVVLSVALGCAKEPTPLALPADLRAVAVLSTGNTTGSELTVSGGTFLERFLGRPLLTVEDFVTAKAAAVLDARGYVIAPNATSDVPALRFDIEEWQTDVPAFEFVLVTVAARLTSQTRDTPLWELRRARWFVPTRGAESGTGARRLAAERIVEELLASWPPANEETDEEP
jgi:hypothetical protein